MPQEPKTYHYALAVRCKQLDIPDMNRGKWMVMLMSGDFVETEMRYKHVQNYLRPLAGEIAVFKIDANDIGQVRVIGLVGSRKAPPLSDVLRADESIRKGFWRRVGINTGDVGATPRHSTTPKRNGMLGWLMPA